MKINYYKLIVIAVASLLIAFTYNFISPDGLNFIREETVVKNVTNIDYGDFSEGSEAAAKLSGIEFTTFIELWNDERVRLIDSRDQWDFKEGHIPGAINIPEFSFQPDDPAVTSLDRSKVYIIYCEGDDCDVSKRLAKEFLKLGFTKVYIYLGGFAEWVGNNMEVEVIE